MAIKIDPKLTPKKLVPKLESLSAVSEGKVDMAFSAAGYWYGKLPAAPLFSSIPYTMFLKKKC